MGITTITTSEIKAVFFKFILNPIKLTEFNCIIPQTPTIYHFPPTQKGAIIPPFTQSTSYVLFIFNSFHW
ncbi:Uncharacterised protein [Moraxella lacunata]|uniref:Uncharacterized protein n=1 Tax=Moraxella lacunata TaxID=477 RepID=A0A378TR13_MORLA|nr:Uncharacterised protein [Moraxella lacunata]